MTISNDPRHSPTILRALVKDGCFYQMEYKDQTNLLFYILLKLYKVGSKKYLCTRYHHVYNLNVSIVRGQQLNNIYHQLIQQMEPLIIPKTSKLQNRIQQSKWQDYLGDAE
jgi:hypothetical protein